MFGNTGKIIEVDLSAGTIGQKTLPEEYYKKYIGGSGLAAKLFWDRGNFTILIRWHPRRCSSS